MFPPTTISAACDFVVSQAADRNIAVGPCVWRSDKSAKIWYFNIASIDGAGEFQCDQLVVQDKSDRTAFIAELVTRRGLLVCLFDDELELAKHCEMLWPCEKITGIRQAIQAEQQVARTN